MRKTLLFTLLALPLASIAASPAETVDKAVQAVGGGTLQQLKTITVKAHSKTWEPGQSMKAGGDMRFSVDSTYTQSRDLSNGATRTEWERAYVYPGTRTYKFIEVLSGGIGYVNGIDTTARTKQSLDSNPPQHTMSGMRVSATMRELERGSPTLVLDMARNTKRVKATADPSALSFQSGSGTYLVMFDSATGLPERIRTRDYDPLEGDSNYDLVLSDWRSVSGIKYPYKQVYQLNGRNVIDTTIDEVSVNAALASDAFAIPEAYRAGAPKMIAPDKVPYQWVLRRPFIGTFLDSDALVYDPKVSQGLRLVDVAPGVSQTQGTSHNSLVVEMDKFLVVFDAPFSEAQSKWVMDAAAKKYPGKPIKYLVLTHHHMDHTNGVRSYAAAGAILVVGQGNGEYFKKVLATPDSLGADAPKKKFIPSVVEVAGSYVITDGRRDVGTYIIENPHADGYLMGYVSDVKLGFVTDLWSPGRDPLPAKLNPALASVVNGVNRWGLAPERFAGGHGSTGSYLELAKVPAN